MRYNPWLDKLANRHVMNALLGGIILLAAGVGWVIYTVYQMVQACCDCF